MKAKKVIVFVLFLLICGVAVMYFRSVPEEEVCDHEFYLSDYIAATASENGYNEYTCLRCGETYRETIPALGEGGEKEEEDVLQETSRTLPLLSLPVYSSSDSPAISHVYYKAEIMDIDGWKHEDCYEICCSESKNEPSYRRWELGGDYAEVSGTIYMRQGASTSYWLEFYDGEQLIFTTPRLSEQSPSVEFSFDVTGVEYLTMYGRREGSSGTWIIADNIYITTATENGFGSNAD